MNERTVEITESDLCIILSLARSGSFGRQGIPDTVNWWLWEFPESPPFRKPFPTPVSRRDSFDVV